MDEYTFHVPPPCDEAVEVVHADADLLVVNKPAGLLSVPGRFVKDCVLSRMLLEFPDVRIVHRLDLDTSGLMVLAERQSGIRKVLSRVVGGCGSTQKRPDTAAGSPVKCLGGDAANSAIMTRHLPSY